MAIIPETPTPPSGNTIAHVQGAPVTLEIVDVRKLPNLTAPEAGIAHTLITYTDRSKNKDGTKTITFSTVVNNWPIDGPTAIGHIVNDYSVRKALVGLFVNTTI